MSEEPNPYAPPTAGEEIMPVLIGTGTDWKLEGESLWVRDGAVLPDVCLVCGETGIPGSRVCLALNLPPLRKMHERRIKISVFRSRRGVAKDILHMIVGPLGGTLAAMVCSEWMVGDGSATAASISASVGLFVLGIVYSGLQAKKALHIVASHDGWHELKGVHPFAMEHFSNPQAVPSHASRKVAKPSSP